MTNVVSTQEMMGIGASIPIPAPFLGLNVRESYTQLQPTEARVLENWLPNGSAVTVRPGHILHQTVSGATTIAGLMKFKGATTTALLAGASDGKVYNVSGAPSALGTGYSFNRWSYDNFNGFIFGVNGTDTPWRYDGTTFSATGFTGPTLTTLQTVSQVRNRLWFTKTSSADVVYGGIAAVTGALTTFQLSQIANGGKCIAIGSWSRDAGDGSDDFTVFVMDTGEVIIYQGDPATSFSLVGKYSAPALVNVDATVKVGGERVLLTVAGPVPITAAIAGNAFDTDALAHWGKIASLWATDYARFGANAGWNAYFFNGIVYFTVQTALTNTRVYVLNTKANNAWTIYTNMPAGQWADLSGSLYFSSVSSNKIFRHAGGTDNGSQILTLARQGASYPGGANRAKQFTMFMPLIDANGPTQMQFALDIDFRDSTLGTSVFDLTTAGTGAAWGAAWGSAWGAPGTSKRRWYSAKGYGRAVAPVVRTLSVADSVNWFASQITAVPGGIT
ncbi:MAG: hypothetical protein RIQ68_501 [Pseudomonadota bacterium]